MSPPRRGRPPTLSADAIVDAAIRVADVVGLEALSMRRVAAELGVAVTTVYLHVENKEDLVNRMRERVFVAITLEPDPATGWKEQLYAALDELYETFRAHRSGIELTFSSPAIFTPEIRRVADGLVAILESGGFPREGAIDALNTLQVFTAGMAHHVHIQNDRAAELRRNIEAGANPRSGVVRHARAWTVQVPHDTFTTGLRQLIDAMAVRYGVDPRS
ncbi:hypothetical protein GCM10009547_16920 [Sporichthya brevicatena]|uniref:HTH tetR-type domain-containing protein n=1 Tax=Sporichthya brevicatena TaxID=171442 RepID=A0ABP3RW05_9ACTN